MINYDSCLPFWQIDIVNMTHLITIFTNVIECVFHYYAIVELWVKMSHKTEIGREGIVSMVTTFYCYGSVEQDFWTKQHLWNTPILSIACPMLLTLWKCFMYNIILRLWYPIRIYVESIINSLNITSLRFISR